TSGFFVFFFQAEAGIRVFHVTGVQTCALPIYRRNDAHVRDEFLRAYISEAGIGLPLYLARIDGQFHDINGVINAQSDLLAELSRQIEETRWHVVNSPMRRVARSLRRMLRPGGKS